ncbi:MAG TPA: DUF1343 domain-containing protein [Blastocatellia bacterium]|nr:DUF1343 domain-containing protein [Blastocatellia bacterium]
MVRHVQMVKTGLDVILESRTDLLCGRRVGLIVNPASVNQRLEHSVDLFRRHKDISLTTLFGPQHGIRGETQDNMIEWASYRDARTGLPCYSLYGETRQPTDEMLAETDTVVFDLQDVGTRVYTFIYTMALAMQACGESNKRFIVLDRPNPISGSRVEGNILDSECLSFVGMFPIPMRHGMTAGELALMFNRHFGVGCELEVIKMEGWRREMWHDETALRWVMTSPNIPTLDTATVYPGAVLLEGTNVSEGRGTTRPFETVGAPFIQPYELAQALTRERLPGVYFRPIYFQPAFHKFAGEVCGGIQIHVTDRDSFKPVITGVAIVKVIRQLYSESFAWKQPPYEYEFERLPFDLIAGTTDLRKQIEGDLSIGEIESSWKEKVAGFASSSQSYLLYD